VRMGNIAHLQLERAFVIFRLYINRFQQEEI